MTPILRLFGCLITLITLAACSTSGQLGMITKRDVDATSLRKSRQAHQTLGPAEGKACHVLVWNIPFGDSDISKAVEHALRNSGGEALIRVTTSKSYWGLPTFYFPVVIFEYSCSTVRGTAVTFR